MANNEPFVPTRTGFLMMHIVPPLIAAVIGSFVTVTVTVTMLSERMATIEERTIQSQIQIDRRFTEIRDVVNENRSDIERRIERIETSIWSMTEGPL